MLYLAFHVLALVGFGQGLRWGQRRSGNIIAIGTVNYGVAALASVAALVLLWQQQDEANSLRLGLLGLTNGCMYFLALLTMLAAYERAGIGITSAVISCGCIVPIICAWGFGWESRLLACQWCAVALLPIAMLLMRPPPRVARRLDLKSDLVLLAAFLVPGVSGSLHATAVRWGGVGLPGQPVYTSGIFLAAFACTAAYAFLRSEVANRGQALLGSGIGLVNVAATIFLVLGVDALGVAVFFSSASPAVIVLHLFISGMLWREMPSRRQTIGVAVSIAVIVLANIGR